MIFVIEAWFGRRQFGDSIENVKIKDFHVIDPILEVYNEGIVKTRNGCMSHTKDG